MKPLLVVVSNHHDLSSFSSADGVGGTEVAGASVAAKDASSLALVHVVLSPLVDQVVVGEELVVGLGELQGLGHDLRSLLAGDGIVGTELAVAVAADEALLSAVLDRSRVVGLVVHIGEGGGGELQAVLVNSQHTHGHQGEVGAGDLVVGLEGPVGVALDDAQLSGLQHVVVVPLVVGHLNMSPTVAVRV